MPSNPVIEYPGWQEAATMELHIVPAGPRRNMYALLVQLADGSYVAIEKDDSQVKVMRFTDSEWGESSEDDTVRSRVRARVNRGAGRREQLRSSTTPPH